MNKDELIALAKQLASAAGVDPVLCCAVVEQESAPPWNPLSYRFEPAFYQRYIAKMIHLTPTEAYARSASWGLMQLMGETAREEGMTGNIPDLMDPTIGLTKGLIHLKKELERANGNVHNALQGWNGGSNPNYAAEVMARMPKYQGS